MNGDGENEAWDLLRPSQTEIVQLVEQSHFLAKHTLDKPGIPRATFYRRYDG